MIDADTIKILQHMVEHRPDLAHGFWGVAYRSLEHDQIQAQQSDILRNALRSCGNVPAGPTAIWEQTEDGELVERQYANMAYHPKVRERMVRNRIRKARPSRFAFRKKQPAETATVLDINRARERAV